MSEPAKSPEVTAPKKIGVYIDGFNLYYGMRESGFNRFYWLDVSALARQFITTGEQLAYTKYFTARISGGRPTDTPSYRAEKDAKRKRQTNYLDALQATGNVQIIEGHYREDEIECKNCGRVWSAPEEKMTDVNIATHLIFDAFAGRFDVAVVVSGDSDLVPPIREISRQLAGKRLHVAFPPARYSNELRKVAHTRIRINETMLGKCQLPDEVAVSGGYKVKRPESWG